MPVDMRPSPDDRIQDVNQRTRCDRLLGVDEMANMIAASKSYSSNVEVMITSRELLQRTLALGS